MFAQEQTKLGISEEVISVYHVLMIAQSQRKSVIFGVQLGPFKNTDRQQFKPKKTGAGFGRQGDEETAKRLVAFDITRSLRLLEKRAAKRSCPLPLPSFYTGI